MSERAGAELAGRSRRGDEMPRWLPRAILLAAAAVAGLFAAGWLLDRLRDLLLVLLVSFILSLALEPGINWLVRRGLRRGAATGLMFVLVFLGLLVFLFALGSLLVSQVADLAKSLPTYVTGAIDWLNSTFGLHISAEQVRQQLTGSGRLQSFAERFAGGAVGLSATVAGALFGLLTVLLFTFYFAAEGPRLRRWVCSLFPPDRQGEILRAWEIARDKTGGYVYSRVLLAVASLVAHYAMLRLVGVPYALPLALWVGVVSQLIPTIGTYLAMVLPLLVAVTAHPVDALWVLGFMIVYQQVENYLLQPRITARTVDIHPAVAFGSVIAGAALLGALGALVAIPLVASIEAFAGTYIQRYAVSEPDLETGPAR
ncbi:MAG TPA: AI-2E family transporter [Mycobacteriales bacterium]|nr:AI-2E family transporter [Mycobacteriales bacterium]